MSKRNFILLIIVLVIALIVFFAFLYFRGEKTPPGDEGTGTNFFSQFNPFGTKPTPPPAKPPVDVSGYVPPATVAQTKLMKISTMPVAGFTLFAKERLKEVPLTPLLVEEGAGGGDSELPPRPKSLLGTPPQKGGEGAKTPSAPLTEFVTAARYVAKINGNIYQTFADKIAERKFSGTIIPKVYDAYFGNHGNSVAMRRLKSFNETIETFVGNLPKELLGGDTSVDNEIKGTFLPDNVKDISVSPDTSKIFYLWESGDSMIGTTLSFLDNKKVQIFDSPFTEWLSSWPSSDSKGSMITLTTKPSAGVLGYMYTIDSNGKNLNKVLGGINGLTTLGSPNGKLILFGDDALSLNIYHTDTRNSDTLGIKTLPEKCVWGGVSDVIYCAVPKSINAGAYPDIWYQGQTSFNDQIWKVDVKTGNTTIVLDPATVEGGQDVDATKLMLDQGENYLFFVNKKDSFLWKLDLK